MDLRILARLAIYGSSLKEDTDAEKQPSDLPQMPTETAEELLERLEREDDEK